VLFAHGKDSAVVKDDLQVESAEIKLVMRLLIESSDIFSLIEEVTYYMSDLTMNEDSSQFARQRLLLMFDTSLVESRHSTVEWVHSKYVRSEASTRKLKYLIVYMLNHWISHNELVQKRMASECTHNTTHTNDMFYHIYLSSSVFNETVAHALQSKQFGEDKKVKKSL
jgi:hypothetical protein